MLYWQLYKENGKGPKTRFCQKMASKNNFWA